MQGVRQDVELVVSASSNNVMPTFGEWDRIALEAVGEHADYISLHRYAGDWTKDTLDYLAISHSVERQIEAIDAVCRSVQARKQTPSRAFLCFDEWNVWDKTFQPGRIDGQGKFAAPLCEEIYTLEDALVVAGFLHSFVRHADVVKIANLAQIVNVLAPLITRGDNLLVQSIYHPFMMFSRRRRGTSLRVTVDGPGYQGESNGQATFVDASAILDGDRLSVFLTNRNPGETAQATVTVADRAVDQVVDAELITGPDAKAANSFEQPDLVSTRTLSDVEIDRNRVKFILPPLSFAASTLAIEA
jgi:alpha-N-arabinofuranosidase